MTTPGSEIIQLGIGDTVPIGQVMANIILMGIVTDINNPNMFAATMQAFQRQAVLTVPVLQGVPGAKGEPSFALQWQNDNKTDPSQLPTDLGDTVVDKGKFWVFGVTDENDNVVATTMYVWWGTAIGWRQLPVGAPGPPGPYPVITPNIELEVPGSGTGPGGADSWIKVDGPASNPVFTFHIAAPQGVAGPASSLGAALDVDFTTKAPAFGDVLTCTSRLTPGAPAGLAILPHGTGGALHAGTYFYKVTATMTNGETVGSNEVTTGALTGNVNSVDLSWIPPSGGGATGFKVYRGTTLGGENVVVAIITNGATTFTDVGGGTTPGTPPSVGAVAGRKIWVPAQPVVKTPVFYTIPEAAFTAALGIGSDTQPICTFEVPPNPWAWKPYVIGQAQIFGANISFTPLLVGAEVRLGAANGQLVGRGYGNSLGYTTFIPHTSDSNNPSTAMTPTNGVGLVPANHTGNMGTLNVLLVNQGMAGVYDFNPANAQLVVMCVPV